MAGKDRSQWSESYRRRIERAEAAGKTRQQARGHRQAEHVSRATRNAERKEQFGVLTAKERAAVRKFARDQAAKGGADPDKAIRNLMSWTTRRGYDAFEARRQVVRDLARQYRNEVKRGVYASRGEDVLDDFDDGDSPEIDDGYWYYYH